jgi:hypothetical protein
MGPLQFVRKKYFGQYLIVRAANMKMTVEIKTKINVNIPGVAVRMYLTWPLR